MLLSQETGWFELALNSRAPWADPKTAATELAPKQKAPPSQTGSKDARSGGLVFEDSAALVWLSSSGFRIDKARRSPGRVCPAFLMRRSSYPICPASQAGNPLRRSIVPSCSAAGFLGVLTRGAATVFDTLCGTVHWLTAR